MEPYKIRIRCDHVTVEGHRRTPVVANARYWPEPTSWVLTAAHNRSSLQEAPEDRERRRAQTHPSDLAEQDSTEIQPRLAAPVLPHETGPAATRYAIACVYPACRRRVVLKKEALHAKLEAARHANIHTLHLDELSVNL